MSPSSVGAFRNARFYSTGKTKIPLGPFSGGLNTFPDPSQIGENELQECVNYLIKPGGILTYRPQLNVDRGMPITNANTVYDVVGLDHFGRPVIARQDTATGLITHFSWNYGTPTLWTQHHTPVAFTGSSNPGWRRFLFYNGIFYYLADKGMKSTTTWGSAIGLTDRPALTVALGTNSAVEAFILKDRMVVVTAKRILWSKATDPTVWAAPDGGFVINPQSRWNQMDAVIFNDTVYVFALEGIWRFSWTSDPSIDGVFEQISNTPARGAVVRENRLFFFNKEGVYELVNGFETEISAKIRDFYRSVYNDSMSFNLLADKLVLGQFSYLGQSSFVHIFDLILNVWYTWKGAIGPTADRAVTFPVSQMIIPYAQGSYFVWAGTSNNVSVLVYMDASQLLGEANLSPYDNTLLASEYMGFRLTTKDVALNVDDRFKRLFGVEIENLGRGLDSAVSGTMTGPLQFKMYLDRSNVAAASIGPPLADTTYKGRVALGKSFRCKRLQLQLDSLSLYTTNNAQPLNILAGDLNFINRFEITIRAAQEVTK
jgi:hypothetical protein